MRVRENIHRHKWYVYVCAPHCMRIEVGLSKCVRIHIGCTQVCVRINRNVWICGPGIILASPHPPTDRWKKQDGGCFGFHSKSEGLNISYHTTWLLGASCSIRILISKRYWDVGAQKLSVQPMNEEWLSWLCERICNIILRLYRPNEPAWCYGL